MASFVGRYVWRGGCLHLPVHDPHFGLEKRLTYHFWSMSFVTCYEKPATPIQTGSHSRDSTSSDFETSWIFWGDDLGFLLILYGAKSSWSEPVDLRREGKGEFSAGSCSNKFIRVSNPTSRGIDHLMLAQFSTKMVVLLEDPNTLWWYTTGTESFPNLSRRLSLSCFLLFPAKKRISTGLLFFASVRRDEFVKAEAREKLG